MLTLLNIFLLPATTLLVIWAIGWLWFASSIYLTPTETIPNEKTDAIIVLTGGAGRINHALDLLEAKIAPKLFISGVNKDVTNKNILSHWKKPQSAEPCCITLGYKSTDTISNANEIKEWVKKNNIERFNLVTSAYHMPRAKLEVRHALPNTAITPLPVVSKTLKNNHWHFIRVAFKEYNKFLIRKIKTLSEAQ